MWQKAEVTMNFTGKLCGSVPLKKEIVEGWLEARMPKEKPEEGKSIEEIKKEVLDSIEEVAEKVTLGFQKNGNSLVVRGGTIKAHVKDCANQIKDAITPKIKNFRGKVANKFFIDEYFVQLLKNGKSVDSEDGEYDQPVHVITQQGPRNALKTIRFLNEPSLKFHIRLMEDKEITKEKIEEIFEYGKIHGYGGERGMGEGRYTFQINWD
jgi:hypothetical protein